MKIINLIDDDVPGDVPFEELTFPDGQPHFRIDKGIGEWDHVQILTRINHARDILRLGLAVDSVRSLCRGRISVNIAYMLGARMDRAIRMGQPRTLRVIAGMLNAACDQANDVRILDPHSPVTTDLIHRSTAILPTRLLQVALHDMATRRDSVPVVVIPDEGAVFRTGVLLGTIGASNPVARCSKKRDSDTGQLSGFYLYTGDVSGRHCLIVDDLCDGGGTFAGISKLLREAGAATVSLCVTHGIFSKDLPIAGIDHVYTTDSYADTWVSMQQEGTTVIADYLRDWVRGPK